MNEKEYELMKTNFLKEAELINKSNIKIFLSQPMTDITKEIVYVTRSYMKEIISRIIVDKNITFVSTYEVDKPDNEPYMWYLSNAILELSKCDLVAFAPTYYKSNGCLVENFICNKYKIPHVYMV